jgi:uncharacterized membrane protein YfcA
VPKWCNAYFYHLEVRRPETRRDPRDAGARDMQPRDSSRTDGTAAERIVQSFFTGQVDSNAASLDPALCVSIAFLVAGFVQGVAGFGAGIVAMAILPIALSLVDAVPVVSLLWIFVTVAVLSSTRGSLGSPRLRATLPLLCLGAAVGVPLGVTLLTTVNPQALRIALGASMLIFVAERTSEECDAAKSETPRPALPSPEWLCTPSSVPSPKVAESDLDSNGLSAALLPGAAAAPHATGARLADHPAVALLVGLSSGVLGGALNEGGPPVVMYLALRRWAKDEVKAALQVYLMLMSLMGLGLLWHRGLLEVRHLQYAASGLPAAVAGIGGGVLLYGRIDQRAFGRVLTVAMLATGVAYIIHATHKLMEGT